MPAVCLLARAKINLVLEVGDKSPDGFHSISTVMQSIDLADVVTLEPAGETSVVYSWAEGLSGEVPLKADLVARAVDLFGERTGRRVEVHAELGKSIPLGAGLGGGSADAAATLAGLNEMTGGAASDDELFALAAELGSDVPFALRGGAAHAEGRGERIRPLASQQFWWVVGFPGFGMSTAAVYERFDQMGTASSLPRRDLAELEQSLQAGDPGRLAPFLRNELEEAAFDLRPALKPLKEDFIATGPLGVVLTGSGSAIAGLCRNQAHAQEVAGGLSSVFRNVFVAASAARGAELVAGP